MRTEHRELDDTVIEYDYHSLSGDLAGENKSLLEGKYEPTLEPRVGRAAETLSATDDRLDIDKLIIKHNDLLRRRLKPSTLRLYARFARRFARFSNLEKLTRAELKTSRGKKLLLGFIDTIPPKCQAMVLSAVKSYWTVGIGDWPVDPRLDLRPFPQRTRRQTPLDIHVRELAERFELSTDPYMNLVWQFTGQLGLRPSQLVRLRWGNIRRDQTGKPVSIFADGTELEFKSRAPVIAGIFPDVADAIEAWEAVCPYRAQNDPIMCHRTTCGKLTHRPLTESLLLANWHRQKKYWGIEDNPIRPCEMRHWVNTACRKSGLSKAATAGLCGHDSSSGDPSMRDYYDSPQTEDLISEQLQKLPLGPLGLLSNMTQLLDDVPTDALTLVARYLKNEIPRSEMADEMDRIRVFTTRNQPGKSVIHRTRWQT